MPTKILFNGRVLTSLIMLSIFIIMTVIALGFPAKARLMPLMVGIPAILLGLAQLIMDYRAVLARKDHQTAEKPETEDKKAEYQMIVWTFLFFIGILGFGFIYASPILVFVFLYFGGRESLKISLISAVSTWAVIYITFVKAFQITLFNGLVINWLFG